jgi:hypothetical protein
MQKGKAVYLQENLLVLACFLYGCETYLYNNTEKYMNTQKRYLRRGWRCFYLRFYDLSITEACTI